MREFSRRTVEALRAALPLRVALPALEPFLADNVDKEIRKDARAIHCAAEALAAGTPPDAAAARALLAEARAIDRQFLERVGGFPVRIDIRYELIEPLRLRRVRLVLDTAYRILEAWRDGRRVRAAFAPGELERCLAEMLRLYAQETLALSDSVRLPRLLVPLREGLAQRLKEAMTSAAQRLSRGAGGRRGADFPSPR